MEEKVVERKTEKACGLVMGGISLSPDCDESDAIGVCKTELRRAGFDPAQLHFEVCKRSVDARKKNDVRLVWSVLASFDEERAIRLPIRSRYSVTPLKREKTEIIKGCERCELPPLVVGMGPAGLFGALLLAENGYRPILIDRGDSVFERKKRHESFVKSGLLDTESNIQFGAGGAGTFSDGKLVTRINDSKISYVLERFCEFGAPRDILVNAKPHIGTDLLCGIVDRMLKRIEELGGTVRYRCRMESVRSMPDGALSVSTSCGDIACSSLILAIGHSARDTYSSLMRSNFSLCAKPFSVGVRIEHLQGDIDEALYGSFAGHERIGKGEYHLSDTSTGRGVYTFCMCPGGEVVAATSEAGGVVVNGMSNFARDGKNANSALLASVRLTDFDGTPAGAIEFQRRLERAAFAAGGGDYRAPIQTVGDFLSGKTGSEPTKIMPTYMGGKVTLANMESVLPKFITDELKHGLLSFDKKIKGFADSSAVLCGVESRTSAPIRILRNESLTAVGFDRVYPCGEGAGYAGGITSAAVDGIRVALALMERFAPFSD